MCSGEKLTDEEVDGLLSGIEDSQGQVNYEGTVAFGLQLCVQYFLHQYVSDSTRCSMRLKNTFTTSKGLPAKIGIVVCV